MLKPSDPEEFAFKLSKNNNKRSSRIKNIKGPY